MHNCTIERREDAGKGNSRVILIHSQGRRGGVWATYALPVGIVGVHPSPWLQGEPTLHSERRGWWSHTPTDFSKFPKALFHSSTKDITGNRNPNVL